MLKRIVKHSLSRAGWAIHRVPRPQPAPPEVQPALDRIQYACGYKYLPGWLNVDIIDVGPEGYLYVNLVERHPFPANHFAFAFCEDFIEHIDQRDSLVFFEEVHRTLKPGGVFRVTFPCLDGVLAEHYPKADFATYSSQRSEVFTELGHVHYYSRESLALVARHIGFDVSFVEPNHSTHEALHGLNTRLATSNLHAELTKRA